MNENIKLAKIVPKMAKELITTIFLKKVEALIENPAWNMIGGSKNRKKVCGSNSKIFNNPVFL